MVYDRNRIRRRAHIAQVDVLRHLLRLLVRKQTLASDMVQSKWIYRTAHTHTQTHRVRQKVTYIHKAKWVWAPCLAARRRVIEKSRRHLLVLRCTTTTTVSSHNPFPQFHSFLFDFATAANEDVTLPAAEHLAVHIESALRIHAKS